MVKGLFPSEVRGKVRTMDQIKRHQVDYGKPLEFPDVATTRARCVGQGHYLTDRERDELRMTVAVLVRDPGNPVDPLAVAVVRRDGRKVGYLSEAKARSLAPVLDECGPVKVSCRVDGSRLWVEAPKAAELRKAVKATR